MSNPMSQRHKSRASLVVHPLQSKLKAELKAREAGIPCRQTRKAKLKANPRRQVLSEPDAEQSPSDEDDLVIVEVRHAMQPPPYAVEQHDGSFAVFVQDGSCWRWSQRPNGSWRKPVHGKNDWGASLDRRDCVPPSWQPPIEEERPQQPLNARANEARRKPLAKKRDGGHLDEINGPSKCSTPAVIVESDSDGEPSQAAFEQAKRLAIIYRHPPIEEELQQEATQSEDDDMVILDVWNAMELPKEAVEQLDGSFAVHLQDGSSWRWSLRPDGSWRKPERHRKGWSSDKSPPVQSSLKPSPPHQEPIEEKLEQIIMEAAAAAGNNGSGSSTGGSDNGREFVEQEDGTLVDSQNGSSLSWTQRPDGTWRKPYRRRFGWVGEMDRQQYLPPPLR